MDWFHFTQDSRYLVIGTHLGVQRLDLAPDRRSEADFELLTALLCGQKIGADANRMEVGLGEVRKAWETLQSPRSPEFASRSHPRTDGSLERQEQQDRSDTLAVERTQVAARRKRDRMRTALIVGQDAADTDAVWALRMEMELLLGECAP